jgi:hypothetical protein
LTAFGDPRFGLGEEDAKYLLWGRLVMARTICQALLWGRLVMARTICQALLWGRLLIAVEGEKNIESKN